MAKVSIESLFNNPGSWLKKTIPDKIPVGCQVAFNRRPDAIWFDVLAINGHTLTIREHGTSYRVQWMDDSLVRQVKPNE